MNPVTSISTEPALAPGVCPECQHANPESAHFCTHCHHTLIYSCPKCWHEQRHGGTCDVCHLDPEKYWRVYGHEAIRADQRRRNKSGKLYETHRRRAHDDRLDSAAVHSLPEYPRLRPLGPTIEPLVPSAPNSQAVPPPHAPQPSFALRDFQLSFLSAPHANPRTSPNPEKQPQPPVIPPPQSHQPSPLTSNTPAAPPRTEAAPQSRPQQARQPTKRSAQVGTIEDCRSAQNAALKLWWNCWTQEAGVAERGGQDSSNCSLR